MVRSALSPYTGAMNEPKQWRTIWISDIHLGTRDCKAAYLLEFLKHNESETLFLVGDIVDGWRLKTSWHFWNQLHNDVVQKVLRKARRGTKVIFVPGNHDEALREFAGVHLRRDVVPRLLSSMKTWAPFGMV